jgi:hypothetical protein
LREVHAVGEEPPPLLFGLHLFDAAGHPEILSQLRSFDAIAAR